MNHRESAPNPHANVCSTSYRVTGKAHDVKESPDRYREFEEAMREMARHAAEFLAKYGPYDAESARLRISQLALQSSTAESETSPIFGQDIVSVYDGVPVMNMESPVEEPTYELTRPDTLKVKAYIPKPNTTNIYLRSAETAQIPEITAETLPGVTQETLLHKLKQEIGVSLSFSRQKDRGEDPADPTVNVSKLELEPLKGALPAGYKWYDETKVLRDGKEVEIGFIDDDPEAV